MMKKFKLKSIVFWSFMVFFFLGLLGTVSSITTSSNGISVTTYMTTPDAVFASIIIALFGSLIVFGITRLIRR